MHRAGGAAQARQGARRASAASSCRSCRSSSRRRCAALQEVPAAQRHARRGDAGDRAAQAATTSASRRRPQTGLIVPVVRDADQQVAVRAGAARSTRLAEATRTGQGDARRADRLDVHHHVAGHARRRAGDADHQLPRGGDPRRAQDRKRRRWCATDEIVIRDMMNLSISARSPRRRRLRRRAVPRSTSRSRCSKIPTPDVHGDGRRSPARRDAAGRRDTVAAGQIRAGMGDVDPTSSRSGATRTSARDRPAAILREDGSADAAACRAGRRQLRAHLPRHADASASWTSA